MVNCDECKEQVLELIEREAIDPEGVRETLAKCPECRAEFDEVKAQLAVASQLPLEAPPDHLDILILQAAEARTTGVAPAVDTLLAEQSAMEAAAPKAEARPRLFVWRPPLAMAAVALLVVGIGISTVSIVRGPGQGQVAEAPAVEETADDAQREDFEEAVGGTEPDRAELAKASTDEVAAREVDAEPPAARQARATRARSPKKKEARAAGRDAPVPVAPREESQRVAAAEADQAAEPDDASKLPSLKTGDSKDALSFGQANGEAGPTTEAQRQCQSTILVFEKRHKDNPNFKPTPQQTLDAGLCYQMLGKRTKAERWLKRAAEHPSTKVRATEALQKLQ